MAWRSYILPHHRAWGIGQSSMQSNSSTKHDSLNQKLRMGILIDTDPTTLSDDAEGSPEHGMGVFCVFIFHQCHH